MNPLHPHHQNVGDIDPESSQLDPLTYSNTLQQPVLERRSYPYQQFPGNYSLPYHQQNHPHSFHGQQQPAHHGDRQGQQIYGSNYYESGLHQLPLQHEHNIPYQQAQLLSQHASHQWTEHHQLTRPSQHSYNGYSVPHNDKRVDHGPIQYQGQVEYRSSHYHQDRQQEHSSAIDGQEYMSRDFLHTGNPSFTHQHETGHQPFVLPAEPGLPSLPLSRSTVPLLTPDFSQPTLALPSSQTFQLDTGMLSLALTLPHPPPPSVPFPQQPPSAIVTSVGIAYSSPHYLPQIPDPDAFPKRRKGIATHPSGATGTETTRLPSPQHYRHPFDASMTTFPSPGNRPSPSDIWADGGGGISKDSRSHLHLPYHPSPQSQDSQGQHVCQDSSHALVGLTPSIQDSTLSISIPRPDGQAYGHNKRPLIESPPLQQTLFLQQPRPHDMLAEQGLYADERLHPVHTPTPVSRTQPLSLFPSTTPPSSNPLTPPSSVPRSIPMPHFRTLVHQRSGDLSFIRRTASQTTGQFTPSTRKSSTVSQRRSSESAHVDTVNKAAPGLHSNQDTTETIGIQLGRLLIFTKEHVRTLLYSFIRLGEGGLKDVDAQLERVLIELLNGILQSHDAFATRDNISSQEQPMNFRPTTLRSLAHLRELLITSSTPPVTRSASPLSTGSTAVRSTSSSRLESPSSSRQRSAPRPPSRLSQSTLPDADPDIENLGQAESHQLPSAALDDESTEIYHSTVEHLALMTALVSVICWVMQTLLNTKAIGGVSGQTNPEGFDKGHLSSIGLNMDMFSGHDGSWNSGHHYSTLKGFLNLFDDQDNILKPISDALARRDDPRSQEHGMPIEMDPSKHVGLFAWHYYLFASDPDGPLVKEAQSISVHQLCSIEFDIILNELYTTHVLSKSVKEHQKDHGQFYTPPAVVDFMWKRATVSYENLLGRFVAITRSRHNQMMGTGGAKGQHLEAGIMTNDPLIPLIPTALDPCLGVSTFLSGYVRLLIHEAQHGHGGEIWNSETTARLLLRQICEHVWGIELDGFAFWMARCGILASMMPLVQRVQELSSMAQSFAQQEMFRYRNDESVYHLPRATTKLPRLHIFRNDTLQLTVPIGNSPETLWERECLLQLRNPSRLQFDFIVTNPPYMIRKTGTFSEADSEVYDWNILGSSSGSTSSAIGSKPRSKVVKVRSSDKPLFTVEERDLLMTSIGNEDAMDSVLAVATPESGISTGSTVSLRAEKPAAQIRSSAKGMMQAYGYFIWFAAQRVRPNTGVTCLITASQWLTLEFATKLRGWLFENCLMDEFFQFEPFKVFSRVQTDSLIFKIRRLDATRPERTLMEHRTVFLRHTDHHKPLSGVLQDYLDYFAMAHDPNNNNLDIMVSSRSRQELSVAIEAPTPTTSTSSSTSTTTTTGGASGNSWTYSFAPMMPTTGLATYLLSLTQGLGGICSAGTKKTSQMEAPEPLLWHRGPNTNPVYGLVVRMEYARASFGEMMTQRWFRQAFYWNGKNSPEETASSTAAGTSAKALHKEGMFWKNRDRLRLYKKEGSPAESYSISTPDPQRMYALCMVDKDSVKMLRQQVEQQVEGAEALWCYLEDVRNHFQPGLASKRRATSSRQGAEDDGIAYCSTNQNGSDVPEKIVHPINYGYFSKTQPRQRFFLDKDSMAMTNQCIYLTLNKHSQHYQARQSTPLIYFLTLLNSSTLQFFVLNHCLYDQQGRMRLFRDSMAKIPFQDWDVKNNHERSRYASRLGELMVELKDLVYKVVSSWYLGDGHVSSHGGLVVTHLSNHGLLDWIRRGGDAPTGVLARTREQVLRMLRTRIGAGGLTHSSSASQSSSPSMSSHIRSSNQSGASMADTDTDHSEETDDDIESDDEDGGYQTPRTTHDQTVEGQRNWGVVDEREYNVPGMGSTNVPQQHIPGGDHHRHSSTTTSTSDIPSTTSSLPSHSAASPVTPNMSSECDRIMQAIERAIAMIEIIQWAVDQYGYMLYGIRPSYQKMLELELKLVYGSIVESLVTSNSPVTEDGPLDRMASAESLLDNTTPQISGQASRTSKDQKRPWASPPTESHASRLGINVTGLYRWDDYGQVDEGEETDHSGSNVTSDGGQLNEPLTPTGLERTQIPSYAPSILANAQVAAQSLRELLERYAYNNRSQTERE